ncbi:thiosulfohydrolase SoxB [Bradyrhizobium tropiciagri]|uniref:thiosulfohydrolase SoxB n=1 Tax=Bradyrhizobium tropiciagri TaxID=312253 RepID=UPI00067A87D2|nr:thiosulfohydrolase SoxB [Bradyrhizobium tropiciagri]
MTTRREILQIGVAAAAITAAQGLGTLGRAAAQQRITEAELLHFEPFGNITLLHLADLHGQLKPVYLREPTLNASAAAVLGLPRATGRGLLAHFGVPHGSPIAHALTSDDFEALAQSYGRIGGLDRAATVIKAVRTERGTERVLLLDGGDTWQGSLTSYRTRGQDMVDCMKLLQPDAMTGHWEFTQGEARVKDLIDALGCPFLAQNVRDTEWEEPVFEAYRMFEKGGVKVAVIGQAFPFTGLSTPRHMIPRWSFALREDDIRANVAKARREGAALVILLSHNGFAIDRKLAGRVDGIDVILTSHTHDPLPEVATVGKTLLVAGGSHGKFISRLDLDVRSSGISGFRFKLIPLFADIIRPDPEMEAMIAKVRAPFAAELSRIVGRTDTLLYRRGRLDCSVDDLICSALIEQRDVEIALSPGFWWGTSLLPGSPIRVEDIHNMTSIAYAEVCRAATSGQRLKDILEDAADSLFNSDPYYQQGGDMIRCGGLSYTIDPAKPIGERISEMTLLRSGRAIEPDKEYVTASWSCASDTVEGPPVWDLCEAYVARRAIIGATRASMVNVVGR